MIVQRLLIALLVACAPGCGGYIALEVDSDPQGANVFFDGEFVGKTPTGVIARHVSNDSFGLTIETMGYKPKALFMSTGDTFSSPEEAEREQLRKYRFSLDPRY